MNKIIENSIVVSNLAKTLLYTAEYRMMNQLSKSFSFFVKPPYQENNKELVNYLRDEVVKLHQEDAKNISQGFYPIDVIKPKGPVNHIINFPRLLVDSLKISRRRKFNIKKILILSP